ncbi:MAG: DUF935 domain-containing protein, partial [Opitutales bacterium]|nr:DUF935 domain-containing protein [Opitutales bacterium]
YIVARIHTLNLPDTYGGPMRSIIFWLLLALMDRDWWSQFLERYGAPFLVGKYDQADDNSRSILERAFSMAKRIGGLVVSRETDVEIRQAAATDSGEAYKTFIELCNREASKLILGQTLSADADATGLGSGVAGLQSETRSDRRLADSRRLGAIIRHQLIKQWATINSLPGNLPIVTWGTISPGEMKAYADFLSGLSQANLQIGAGGLDRLSEILGFPIERKPAAPTGMAAFTPDLSRIPVRSFAATPEDDREQLERSISAAITPHFRRRYADLPRIIASAETPKDAEDAVADYLSKLSIDGGEAVRVIEESLNTYAALGAGQDR